MVVFSSNWPKQEFIAPHCTQKNGMVERVFRTVKDHRIHRQRCDEIQRAMCAIKDWIGFYKN